ncbi:Cation/H(+) antiporter 12 [Linum perenne]
MNETYVHLVIGILMALASSGDALGVYYLFGPFLFGLVIPAGSPLATSVIAKLETAASGIFLPMLLAISSTTFDIYMFIENYDQRLNFQISVHGYIIKLVLTLLSCLACKMSVRDSIVFTLIVNTKGVLEVASMLSFSGLAVSKPYLLLPFTMLPLERFLTFINAHTTGRGSRCGQCYISSFHNHNNNPTCDQAAIRSSKAIRRVQEEMHPICFPKLGVTSLGMRP